MILSSCDFSNPNSKQVILDNLDKELSECKVLFIPNQNATYEKIHSDKYYNRLKENGFIKKGVIYIGGSCGAHIVSKNIEHLLKLDDNYIGITDFNALGLFDGIIIPHCEAKEYTPELREEIYNKLLKEEKYNVYKLTNDESLIVTENGIVRK